MSVDQDRLRDLKEDAKWASSIEGQMRAVRELGILGEVALPSLKEILQISVRDEIKQCCYEAIRQLGRDNKGKTTAEEKKSPKVKRKRRKTKTPR